jgi:phosphoserine/homoserine phosphotransferase
MAKLGFPTLLCHSLTMDAQGNITHYNLRIDNQKQKAVQAFQALNYQVIAFGDSYNDIAMIQAADHGFFFKPPETVAAEYPDISVTRDYDELRAMLSRLLDS